MNKYEVFPGRFPLKHQNPLCLCEHLIGATFTMPSFPSIFAYREECNSKSKLHQAPRRFSFASKRASWRVQSVRQSPCRSHLTTDDGKLQCPEPSGVNKLSAIVRGWCWYGTGVWTSGLRPEHKYGNGRVTWRRWICQGGAPSPLGHPGEGRIGRSPFPAVIPRVETNFATPSSRLPPLTSVARR